MDDGAGRVALVCVRDSRRFGLQVLSRSMAAAAGPGSGDLFFPGDRTDSGDHAARTLRRCHDLTGAKARRLLGHEMTPAHAMGYWVAAARVLLVTTGLLFAVKGERRIPVQRRVPPRERQALSGSGLDLANFLIREQLYCDLGRLFFFAQWLTPVPVTPQGSFLSTSPPTFVAPARSGTLRKERCSSGATVISLWISKRSRVCGS